jgi:hypothetical protein
MKQHVNEEQDCSVAVVASVIGSENCSSPVEADPSKAAAGNANAQIHRDAVAILKDSPRQADLERICTTRIPSTRHGARNQHRHKIICKWLLERFPLAENSLILDVAGGKGELASRLTMCHHLRVVMVDPRPADISSVYCKTVLTKLPKKWQQRVQNQIGENPTFVEDILKLRFRQLCMCFDDGTAADCLELNDAIQESCLIIGMHADGATEAIVNAALQYNKAFVVIPCCVFPNLFAQRFILDEQGRKADVRNHDQFCQFLVEKDNRFRMEILPFEGRNVAIWWDGK